MPWTPEGHQIGHRDLTRCRLGCEVAARGQWWSAQNFKRRVGRFSLPGDALVIDGEVEERGGEKGILAIVGHLTHSPLGLRRPASPRIRSRYPWAARQR